METLGDLAELGVTMVPIMLPVESSRAAFCDQIVEFGARVIDRMA